MKYNFPINQKSKGQKNGSRSHAKLIEAIQSFRTPEGLRLFLDDLLTADELAAINQRFEASIMLYIGTPYKTITNITGLSSTTISRIAKLMINKRGGFWEAIRKMYPNGYKYSE